MAIVVYKCDTCKREIELEQNPRGLENISRCTITHGCRGKLYQVKVLPDYVRGRLPDAVAGLDDWRQRKVLYNHSQTIERDEWIITHNLGTFPSISVFVNQPTEDNPNNQEEIEPTDTVIVNEDKIILRFDKAWSGLAQLVARQSDPDLLRPVTGLAVTAEALQQLSINGEIAIATRKSTVGDASDIELGVQYATTQNTLVDTFYTASENLVGTESPWRDIDEVIIKGKIFTVRSFDGIIPEMGDETIASGSTFYLTSVNSSIGSPTLRRAIAQDEVYILFASNPFDTVDKITDQYIDVYDITATENQFTLIFDTGEFFADTDIIQDIYPPIRPVL